MELVPKPNRFPEFGTQEVVEKVSQPLSAPPLTSPARGRRLEQICKRPGRISQRDRIDGELSLDQAPHDGDVALGVDAERIGDT